MADAAELHQEARELPVRQHNELISQQFALACHLPQHPCYQLCHRPPDDRPERRRYLIGRFRPNIHQCLAEEQLSDTSYKSAISRIYQDAVRTAIESNSPILLNGRSPPIATAEQLLPRKTRSILAQLLTGHSRIRVQYMKRIDPTARNHCHNCGQSPHDTHHLFDCPSKPTTQQNITQQNRYGLRRPKPISTSTWRLMRRVNHNNDNNNNEKRLTVENRLQLCSLLIECSR